LTISGQVTGNARWRRMQDVIPAIQNCRAYAQSFVVKLCALSVFRKADRFSGPAQKNNPKAVVLTGRARRIKFDDSNPSPTSRCGGLLQAAGEDGLILLGLTAMAPMVTDRPSGLEIEPGYSGNDIEPGLALDAHRLKCE
jgi:hypothetical protein